MKRKFLSIMTTLVMVMSLAGVLPVVTAGAYVSGDWEYVRLSATTAQITKFNGTGVFDVTIPSSLGGYTITEIGEDAFADYVNGYSESIESVIMPDTITKIWDRAFQTCTSLSYVKFSSNLKEIHEYAFCDTNLKNVILSEGLQVIGENAFYNGVLQTAYIPSSVIKIEDNGIPVSSTKYIYAPFGSYAQRYAAHNNISFRSTTKPNIAKCSKPRLKKAKKALKVSWNQVSGAAGYNVLYSRKKSFSGSKMKTVQGTSKKIKGLKKKKKYYVKVRAYSYYYSQTGSPIKVCGSWSKPNSKKTK